MKTLATSNSIIGNNRAPPYVSASSLKERLLCGGPEFISYRRPRKLASFGLQHLVPLRRGGIDVLSCFSSHPQEDTHNDAIENQDTTQSKTVRVKFQIRKECTFGEHFFVVGDDPIFGSWDVTNAIPLNWADGHQWAAEVEIPVGKKIQFKFVLIGKTGNIIWQPDPDRTLQPWETTNIIVISEDWDNAELRILSEEEKILNQDEDSPIVPEKLTIEEKLTNPNEELIHNSNKDSSVVLADTSIAEKSSVDSHGELIDCCNISASEENGRNVSALEENISNVSLSEDNASNIPASKENAEDIVAENISSPKESFILNTSNKAASEVHSNSNGDTTITSQSDTKITEEILKTDVNDATVKILRNTDVQESFSDYGVPTLVPGLPPTPTTSNQDAPQHEVKDDVSVNGDTTITSQSDTKITEEILKTDVNDATVKILRNTDVQESFSDYGVPTLVPGLPPTPTTSNQDAPQHEVKDDVSVNGIIESNDHKLPENIQMNQKQDPDVVAEQEMEAKSSYEEDVVQSEIRQEDDTNKIENNIVQNDITWGHKTLKKFFSNLRLL